MKKLLTIFCLAASAFLAAPVLAFENETTINALNLNVCQKQQLNELDDKYAESSLAAGQTDAKSAAKSAKQYEKELKRILTRKQRTKLKTINRLDKKADKRGDERMFKPDPNFNVFGMKPECKCKGRAKKKCPNHSL